MNAPLPDSIRQALNTVTLDDKYALDYGHAFMSGVQALVKLLPLLQRLRDQQVGKNTAGLSVATAARRWAAMTRRWPRPRNT